MAWMQFLCPRMSKWHLELSSGPATAQVQLPAPSSSPFGACSASALCQLPAFTSSPHQRETWATILDFFQQEFSSQTPPGGLIITSRDPKLLIKVEISSPREGSSKEFSIPSTSTWKGGSGGCLARLAQLGRDLHWIYCRFLEEKRPKRANQGVDAGIQGCRWDLPAFTGRGAPRAGSGVPWIAASLCCWSGHCSEAAHGKRARQRGQKA